jgi:hypothetical protein
MDTLATLVQILLQTLFMLRVFASWRRATSRERVVIIAVGPIFVLSFYAIGKLEDPGLEVLLMGIVFMTLFPLWWRIGRHKGDMKETD